MPVDRVEYERQKAGLTSEIDSGLKVAEHHERERAEALKYVEQTQKRLDELNDTAQKAGLSG